MKIGLIERPQAATIDAYKILLQHDSITCAISDCLGHANAMSSNIKPLFDGIRIVGTAVTVRTLASDLAASFKAIDLCQFGDILVVDAHGSENTALWGANMTLSAANRGVVAAVLDGACRDVEEIRRMRFPVLCKGIVPNVGSVSGYGAINVPIQCGGVPVSPGDIVVIDGNGVVVVPSPEAADVLDRTRKLIATEHTVHEKLKAGVTIGQLVNIDAILEDTLGYQEKAAKS